MLFSDYGLWALEKLIGYKPDDIKIEVKLVPLRDMSSGLRAYVDNLDHKKTAPKRFRITLPASCGNVPTMRRMGHEMVHVKQWYLGEMVDDHEALTTMFAGKVYDRTMTDEDCMSYWDWPWEVEAHGREVGLLEQYRVTRGYRGRSCWWWDLNEEV